MSYTWNTRLYSNRKQTLWGNCMARFTRVPWKNSGRHLILETDFFSTLPFFLRTQSWCWNTLGQVCLQFSEGWSGQVGLFSCWTKCWWHWGKCPCWNQTVVWGFPLGHPCSAVFLHELKIKRKFCSLGTFSNLTDETWILLLTSYGIICTSLVPPLRDLRSIVKVFTILYLKWTL